VHHAVGVMLAPSGPTWEQTTTYSPGSRSIWLLAIAPCRVRADRDRPGLSTAAIVVVKLLVGIAFGPYGGSLADRPTFAASS
jgi:hypothetical protein